MLFLAFGLASPEASGSKCNYDMVKQSSPQYSLSKASVSKFWQLLFQLYLTNV